MKFSVVMSFPDQLFLYSLRSNCDPEVMNIIRKHYQKPEFIPDDSESSELDWIFVGGYGKGAQMHVSYFQL